MRTRLACLVLAMLIAGCAVPQPYSDAGNVPERKAYIACAVTRAFLQADPGAAPEDIARSAIHRCEDERHAVMLKLLEENAGKPFGAAFVGAYMDTLQATMLDHIALRLAQSRARASSGGGI